MGSQKSSITYNQQPNAAPYIGLQLEETKTLTRRPSSGHTIYHMAKLTLCLFAVFFNFLARKRDVERNNGILACIQRVYVCIYTHKPLHPHTIYVYCMWWVDSLNAFVFFFTFGDFLRLNFQYVMRGYLFKLGSKV